MKKLLFLTGLLSVSFMLFAQQEQIEDGGFETKWSQKPSYRGSYWEYAGGDNDMMRTLNSLYALEMSALRTELTSFRETNTPYGNYALRMESVSFQNTLFVPGAFGTISPTYIEEFLDWGGIESSADFYSRPLRLTGYYKYAPVNNDSASIEIELTNYGETRIAYTLWKEKNTVSEWTPFDITIDYVNDWIDVTELRLIFSASAGYNFADLENCKGQVGSKFWIDNIAFEYTAGLREPLMERTASKVYPNPAATTTTISFDKALNGKLVVYNMLGAEVLTQTVDGDAVEINVSHLSKGAYLYRVIEENNIRTSGKFVIE